MEPSGQALWPAVHRVIELRAVTSTDGMTADSYRFPHAFLACTATSIVNEVRGIKRVVYDVTSKPPRSLSSVGGGCGVLGR